MQLRPLGGLVAAAVLATAGSGIAGATTRAVAVTVGTRTSALGKVLVSADGRTLYHASTEKKGAVGCTGACAVKWPPLLISGSAKPVAGSGVKASMLGTIKRPNGRIQVTYDGLALYLYSGDKKAGELNGQGVGGTWHAIAPTGVPVTKATGSSMGATSGSTSSASSGSSGSTMGAGGPSSTSTTGATGSGASAAMWCAANPKDCVNGVPVTGSP